MCRLSLIISLNYTLIFSIVPFNFIIWRRLGTAAQYPRGDHPSQWEGRSADSVPLRDSSGDSTTQITARLVAGHAGQGGAIPGKGGKKKR